MKERRSRHAVLIIGLVQEDRIRRRRRRRREEVDECAWTPLARLSSTKKLNKTRNSGSTKRKPDQLVIIKWLFGVLPKFFCVLKITNGIWEWRVSAYLVGIGSHWLYWRNTLYCCGLLTAGDYVTDQRHGKGYWLLLGNIVAILNTTPQWRGYSQTCYIQLSNWIGQ